IVTEEVTVGDAAENNDAKDENKNVDKTVNDENENNKVEEELEDQTPPTTDDAVENNEPTEEKANSPPVEAANEEVEEAEEEADEETEEDELTIFAEEAKDLGNIFEFESFQKDEQDIENGAEIEFNTQYQLQYSWQTEGIDVKAGDTATLQLPDVFEHWTNA